jgi:hypothetical protein
MCIDKVFLFNVKYWDFISISLNNKETRWLALVWQRIKLSLLLLLRLLRGNLRLLFLRLFGRLKTRRLS